MKLEDTLLDLDESEVDMTPSTTRLNSTVIREYALLMKYSKIVFGLFPVTLEVNKSAYG